MAHYALINKDNIVVDVITGVDENIIQTDWSGELPNEMVQDAK